MKTLLGQGGEEGNLLSILNLPNPDGKPPPGGAVIAGEKNQISSL
jgi:hypothetical protein